MFVAHLPAGYLLTRAIRSRAGDPRRGVMAVGLAASVAPDLDLLRFYLLDGRRVLHHDYATHTPALWLAACAALWGLLRAARVPRAELLAGVALANLLGHLALDTVAGGIRWTWPLSEATWRFVEVPAGHRWWVWNFVLHWTFALELAICAAALRAWWRHPA